MKDELAMLETVDHQHCTRIMQLLEDEAHIYIVMEHLQMGDLKNFIVSNEGLTTSQCEHVLKQLLDALNYLHHQKNIVHRDLKLENLLVEEVDSQKKKLYIKLADFGFSTRSTGSLNKLCGTPGYMAPEIDGETQYSTKVDIFAFGVIAFMLFSGNNHPFYTQAES